MKFIKADSQPENTYYHRMVSECGRMHIMIMPVLYGYRIRIGKTADKWGVLVDACAGSEPQEVSNLYNLYLLAMEQITDDKEMARFLYMFQSSVVKPYMNDQLFKDALYVAAGVADEAELHEKAIVDFRSIDLIKMKFDAWNDIATRVLKKDS